MHLKQPRFTYSACGPFTKNKERIIKFKGTGDSRYIYQNQTVIVYFICELASGDFNYLPWRTASDKVLPDKAFYIAVYILYSLLSFSLVPLTRSY